MRLTIATAAALCALLAFAEPASAGGAYNGNTPRAGGSISHGNRPTAVVVVDGSGSTIGSWSSPNAGGRAPDDWRCVYHPFVGAPGAFELTIDWGATPVLEPGQHYALVCRDGGGRVVYQQPVLWDPSDPFSGLLVPERLADEAYASLDLPAPRPATSPPLDRPQLVGVRTWLWLDSWQPVTATATIGALTATVTATPLAVTWSTHDGITVDCPGPGQPYRHGGTTDCAIVWQHRTTDRPGGGTLTATVTWGITWTATNGETGDLGTLTSSTTSPVTVTELQAVITG